MADSKISALPSATVFSGNEEAAIIQSGVNKRAAFSNIFAGYGQRVYNVKTFGALGDGVTDDTVAIQLAITTCFNGGGGIVWFPNGIYIIGGALQTSVSGQNPNCQLYIPQQEYVTAGLKTIQFIGESVPQTLKQIFTGGTVKTGGVILQSTILGSGSRPRVIGSVKSSADNFNYCGAFAQNIQIRTRSKTSGTDIAPTVTGFGMGFSYNFNAIDCIGDTESTIFNSVLPATSTVSGFEMPFINNSGTSGNHLLRCTSSSYYNGFELSDHAYLVDCCAVGSLYGYNCTAASQPITILNCQSLDNKYDLVFTGACTVNVQGLKIEESVDATRWFFSAFNFYAPSNVVSYGKVSYYKGSVHTVSGSLVAFGNVTFEYMKGSARQVSFGGAPTPSNGGTAEWTGLINSSSRAILELGSVITSSGSDGQFSQFVISHQQSGVTGEVGGIACINKQNAPGGERRIVSILFSNNGAVNKGQIRFYINSSAVVAEAFNINSDTVTAFVPFKPRTGSATAGTVPVQFTSGTVLTTAIAGGMEYNNTFHLTNSDATRRHVVLAPNTTKVTAAAPYANDGYIVMNIGGTDFKVMTTA